MYIDQRHIIVIYIILILLLAVPLILQTLRIKLFRNFNFPNLVKVLNRSIIPQLIIGVIITIIAVFFDKVFYSDDKSGNIFLEIFIESTYCYIVIGSFFYLPAIGLINIIKLLINRLNKKPTSR
jgi:hypothetical protein